MLGGVTGVSARVPPGPGCVCGCLHRACADVRVRPVCDLDEQWWWHRMALRVHVCLHVCDLQGEGVVVGSHVCLQRCAT